MHSTNSTNSTTPLVPAELTLVQRHGGADTAVYENGKLIECGHTDDVMDKLLARLGIAVEEADFVTDHSARGWAGVAQSLEEIPGLA